MKCTEIDIIGYIDKRADAVTSQHIETCKKCTAEVARLKQFSGILSTHYARGKALEKDLDKRLVSIDMAKMKRLPSALAEKAAEMKGKSLAEKVKKIVGTSGAGAKAFLDSLMNPEMHAMPASPKEITKTKKKTTIKKK